MSKALINSINGEEHSLERVLPLAKEHDAAIIGLRMDNNRIPATDEKCFLSFQRLARIYEQHSS
jgi:5-methyltetrahydrofolate--homocysteine methyltransferase